MNQTKTFKCIRANKKQSTRVILSLSTIKLKLGTQNLRKFKQTYHKYSVECTVLWM